MLVFYISKVLFYISKVLFYISKVLVFYISKVLVFYISKVLVFYISEYLFYFSEDLFFIFLKIYLLSIGISKICTMYIYLGAKSRGSDAVQNVWMINSANFVLTKIRPKVFWGENAPGLFTTGIIYIQLIRP